jgi:hypothetical protein
MLEGFSALALEWRHDVGYADLESEKSLVADQVDPATTGRQGRSFWRQRESQVHPYFGYTMVPGSKPWLNNAGFAGEYDYPYVPAAGELVVGVFGGSVAHGLYFWIKRNEASLRDRFLRLARGKGFERVTFLCFANGGYLQPISTNVLLYYMGSVDIALFVEGFNELQISASNRLAEGYPADFPYRAYWETLANDSISPAALRLIGRLANQNERMARATTLARRSPLNRSALVHLAWQAYTTRLESRSHRLRERLDEVQRQELRTRYNGAIGGSRATEEEQVEAFLGKYRAYLRSAHAAARANDVIPVFVLQPSQYLPGAKPLSAVEQREHTTNRRFAELVTSYYPRFVRMFEDLAGEGLLALDMTGVFRHTAETTYADSCCHLEDRGNEVLMRGILDELARSDEFAASLPAGGSVPSLSAGG